MPEEGGNEIVLHKDLANGFRQELGKDVGVTKLAGGAGPVMS